MNPMNEGPLPNRHSGISESETDDLLTILFSKSHFMMVLLDTQFNYVRVSHAYARANGREPEFYIKRHFFDYYPEKADAVFFQSAIKRGEPVSCLARRHLPLNSPMGPEAYRNWDIIPLKDPSGTVKKILVCMFDITSHVKTAKLLGESEERFNSFFEDAPVGLGILDENLRYLKVNSTYAALNGLPVDNHIGRHISEVVPDLSPKVIPIFNQVIQTGTPLINYEYSGKRKDGSGLEGGKGHWVLSAFPISWDCNRGIGYIVMDITSLRHTEEKLKKSETLLQSVFDGLSIPMMVLEKDRTVRFLNKAALAYYGSRPQNILGKPCHLGLRGEAVPCEGCEIWDAVPKGTPVTIERTGLMNSDLIEIVRIYPWIGTSGELTGSIITISDETQARILERQMLQHQKLASIGLLVSGIAHEINNANNFVTFNIPILHQYLKAILPFVETHGRLHPDFELFGMSIDNFRKDLFELLENLSYGSSRIKATVSALRDFSRINSEANRSWVNMDELVSKVAAICQSELSKRVKSFKRDTRINLPPIYLDAKAIEQVLVNLVLNAAYAADKENSWVKLRVSSSEKKDTLILEVSDNGKGMDEKTRERIFDPFFTTKPSGDGTGLGLYISQNLVEKMGGKIKMDSEPGKGTIFKVILPLTDHYAEHISDQVKE